MEFSTHTVWILGFVAVFVGVGFGVYLHRGPEDFFLHAILRSLNTVVTSTLHRVRVNTTRGSVPDHGPCIVVANHRSGADPSLVARVTKRRLRYLMAREYYEIRGLEWLFRMLGCIPVNRDGNDLGAIRQALRALADGDVICIFPQGGIADPESEMSDSKAGVGLLGLRSGAPIIPVYVDGSPVCEAVIGAVFFRVSRSRIYCGAPFRLDSIDGETSRERITEATRRILGSVDDLRKDVCGTDDPVTETASTGAASSSTRQSSGSG